MVDSEAACDDTTAEATRQPGAKAALSRLLRRLRSAVPPVLTAIVVPPVLTAMIVLVLAVLGFVAAAVGTLPDERGGVRSVSAPMAGPLTHHPLPELLADLKPTGRKTHFAQVSAVIELAEEAVPLLKEHETVIVSELQTRLRDRVRIDLAGASGVEKLRDEMIAIIDARIAPNKVNAVLFTRFLVD